MSRKDANILKFWYEKLDECCRIYGVGMSAGSVANHVGQSRNTAKKYLKRLVEEGGAVAVEAVHVNGQGCTLYAPLEG